jgi:hypothetical protein
MVARVPYGFEVALGILRARGDFLRVAFLRWLIEPPDAFSSPGELIILRTAATRSELRPRICPISSGVGTGLPIMWAPIVQL